jgi:hypothetical protein
MLRVHGRLASLLYFRIRVDITFYICFSARDTCIQYTIIQKLRFVRIQSSKMA